MSDDTWRVWDWIKRAFKTVMKVSAVLDIIFWAFVGLVLVLVFGWCGVCR